MTVVRIPVRAEHDYEVVIGRGTTGEVAELLGRRPRKVLLLHPGKVERRALTLEESLRRHGYAVHRHPLPDAEAAKTVDVAAECWSVLGRAAFSREDAVIGLGGGATTDLAGFVAATWLRGVRVVQVPTTLLAMVDAAVGGKTGINTPEGKNLVGAFHSPSGVLCDLDSLATLPGVDLRAGLAEVVKCGFIADPGILELVEADPGAATDPASGVLAELVERSVAVKARVVGQDLREAELREILNYGHTFGHAIEQVEQFRPRHGDAVSVGMVFSAELAHAAGLLAPDVVDRHRRVLGLLGLPTTYRQDRWPELLEAMLRDKKTRRDTLRFVVLAALADPTRLVGPAPHLLAAAYAAVSP